MTTIAEVSHAFGGGHHTHALYTSNAYVSGESAHPKSPLRNLLHGVMPEKKTKYDGQLPKKRGPKPDSKPALTRRQELNRQAQRTHRERKEIYIKALEQEVSRLKESYGDVCKERESLAAETRKLRNLLTANGLGYLIEKSSLPMRNTPSCSGSISGIHAAVSIASSRNPPPPAPTHSYGYRPINSASQRNDGNDHRSSGINRIGSFAINYDIIGIEFVLALERPCMDHMQMLCVKSQESEGDISGHALMATCPPESHLIAHPKIPYPHRMPDMHPTDLLKLLDLSTRLPLEGEITPVMAWSFLLRSERSKELTARDFQNVKIELLTKVRCYGFGAVLEEFEVKDALERVLTDNIDAHTGYAS